MCHHLLEIDNYPPLVLLLHIVSISSGEASKHCPSELQLQAAQIHSAVQQVRPERMKAALLSFPLETFTFMGRQSKC